MEGKSKDTYRVNATDREMTLAMQKARDTFSEFREEVLQDYCRKIPVLDNVLIKACFFDNGSRDSGEHLWLGEIDLDGEWIVGEIASPPEHIQSVQMGQRVSIALEQLSDWLYVYDGKAHGAFTVRVLRQRLSPEELQEHDGQYPFSFD